MVGGTLFEMHGARRILLVVLVLVGPGFATRALADGWDDARNAFHESMRSPEWKKRRDALLLLSDYDGQEAVEEILPAAARDPSPAVAGAAIEVLRLYASSSARDALVEVARDGKGRERLLALVALETGKGPEVTRLLLEVAAGKDAEAAAQAALDLGRSPEPHPGAAPVLIDLLAHKDWQVRAAAARSLARRPDESAVPALVRALDVAKGRDRADVIVALETTTKQAYGNDAAAWKRLAGGQDPATIKAHPELPPSAFGIPIYGQRVVVVLDDSLRMGDPHPFDADRLRALSDPPDGAAIPWFRVKTNGQFAISHVRHLVHGMPRGSKIGLITVNAQVTDALSGFVNAGASASRRADEVLDGLVPDDGLDTLGALDRALDFAGDKDATAWNRGPDEILFVTVNMPLTGDVREADVVAAAIGLRARLRMVTIDTVGIHFHPYDMCRALAERTGGTYVDLVK